MNIPTYDDDRFKCYIPDKSVRPVTTSSTGKYDKRKFFVLFELK